VCVVHANVLVKMDAVDLMKRHEAARRAHTAPVSNGGAPICSPVATTAYYLCTRRAHDAAAHLRPVHSLALYQRLRQQRHDRFRTHVGR
jgi:hypothetical protein